MTLAISVAIDSQVISSISPCGSINLTPLSSSGLCEAVIITPIAARKVNEKKRKIICISMDSLYILMMFAKKTVIPFIIRERNTAKIPILNTT